MPPSSKDRGMGRTVGIQPDSNLANTHDAMPDNRREPRAHRSVQNRTRDSTTVKPTNSNRDSAGMKRSGAEAAEGRSADLPGKIRVLRSALRCRPEAETAEVATVKPINSNPILAGFEKEAAALSDNALDKLKWSDDDASSTAQQQACPKNQDSSIQKLQNGATMAEAISAGKVFDEMPSNNLGPICSSDHSATLGSNDTASSQEFTTEKSPNAWEKPPSTVRRAAESNGASGFNIDFFEDADPNEGVTVPEEELSSLDERRGPTIIGYVPGRFPGRQAFINCAKSWKKPTNITFHPSGWVLFQFASTMDMNEVLENGPYFIFGRPLLLKVIPPLFRFEDEEIYKVPVWVKLRGLPHECWNGKVMGRILSCVGKPVRSDKHTAMMTRLTFARALVEVNVSKELIKEVPVTQHNGKKFMQTIEYEYVPFFCSNCKVVGRHTAEFCPAIHPRPNASKAKRQPKQPVGPSNPALSASPSHQAKNQLEQPAGPSNPPQSVPTTHPTSPSKLPPRVARPKIPSSVTVSKAPGLSADEPDSQFPTQEQTTPRTSPITSPAKEQADTIPNLVPSNPAFPSPVAKKDKGKNKVSVMESLLSNNHEDEVEIIPTDKPLNEQAKDVKSAKHKKKGSAKSQKKLDLPADGSLTPNAES